MELARHPYVTAGVALAAASMIAVTPVAPPPLPDVQVPAVQLTAATDLLGDVPGILGGLESAVAADLGSAGSLGSIGGLLDPLAGLAGLDSGILTALINAIMALETATDNGALLIGLATPLFGAAEVLLPTPFTGLATPLFDLALVLLLTGTLQQLVSVLLPGASASTMLADPAIGLSSLGALLDPSVGSALVPGLDPTASVVSDLMLSPTTAVSDLGTMLNPGDLTALLSPGDLTPLLNPGDLAPLLNPGDLGTLLNPADFATLFDPAGISSMVGVLAADIPTMLLSLIP